MVAFAFIISGFGHSSFDISISIWAAARGVLDMQAFEFDFFLNISVTILLRHTIERYPDRPTDRPTGLLRGGIEGWQGWQAKRYTIRLISEMNFFGKHVFTHVVASSIVWH